MIKHARAFIGSVVVAAALSVAPAKARTYDIDIVHSNIVFFIDHLGFSRVVGVARDFGGNFQFDPANLAASSLDVAVNNAGIFRSGQPLADVSDNDWHSQFDTNVTGVFHALRAEIRRMRTQPDGGAIVNISSTLGAHKRHPGTTAYAATKAAVSVLTRGAALDHVSEGIRINAVSPGATGTGMSLQPGETEAGRAERMRHEVPVGRVSTVEEVAAAVLYLASDDAASTVGTDLVLDGGQTA